MVEETIGLLNDWTGQQPQQCSLTTAIDETSLSFTVDDAQQLGQGLIEIDEELVYVSAFDNAGGAATVSPWGRGQQGSTAAAHAVGARVTTAPRPPRLRIRRKINQVITGLYPDLFAVKVDEQTADDRLEYPAPAGVKWVIDASWQTTGFPQVWERIRGWRLSTTAESVDFPSGASISISAVPIGQPIRVVYAAEPTQPAALTDDFAAVTGLHEGVADLVVMAAAAQLVVGQELSRAQLSTMEQAQRADKVQTGASLAASRFLQQTYEARVAAERRRLLLAHPSRPHFEGV